VSVVSERDPRVVVIGHNSDVDVDTSSRATVESIRDALLMRVPSHASPMHHGVPTGRADLRRIINYALNNGAWSISIAGSFSARSTGAATAMTEGAADAVVELLTQDDVLRPDGSYWLVSEARLLDWVAVRLVLLSKGNEP